MVEIIDNITVVLISHKSRNKVISFVKNFSSKIKIIIVENSNDKLIKKEIEKINPHVKLIFSLNNGYGSAINLASKSVKTNYFFVFNPDVENINDLILKEFLEIAKKLNDTFACIGPRYINISKKTLIQSDQNKTIDTLPSISGASMFFNKDKFDIIGGFDENIFLYFEETDYCLRAKKKKLFSYQLNTVKVNHRVGTSVELDNDNEQKEFNNLLRWHFVWSKFYFFKKHYGFTFSLIFFIPMLVRTIIKIFYFKIFKNKTRLENYKTRFNGLMTSIKGKNSYKRISF